MLESCYIWFTISLEYPSAYVYLCVALEELKIRGYQFFTSKCYKKNSTIKQVLGIALVAPNANKVRFERKFASLQDPFKRKIIF